MKIINIDSSSTLPKYKQIIYSIETAIAEKRLKKGDLLPSVNKIAIEFSLSRDTVLLAYDDLKKRGVIYARLGKGYYVKSEEFAYEQRIFLLFDEFNSFKEDLYNSFISSIGNNAQVDIFFHYFNIDVFKKLINENNGDYSKYIIMPTTLNGTAEIIKLLPKNSVFILDQTNPELYEYPSIHQNFAADMFNGLTAGFEKILKYKKLVLIFPTFKQPPGMKEGFINFCRKHNLAQNVLSDFEDTETLKDHLYIIPNDRHLVQVIENAKKNKLKIGRDIGIISYNDTPLKKVVENGITTISTDFTEMGRILAHMVLYNDRRHTENKSSLIERSSL